MLGLSRHAIQRRPGDRSRYDMMLSFVIFKEMPVEQGSKEFYLSGIFR